MCAGVATHTTAEAEEMTAVNFKVNPALHLSSIWGYYGTHYRVRFYPPFGV